MDKQTFRYTKSGKLIVPGVKDNGEQGGPEAPQRVENKGAGPLTQRRTGTRGDR